MLFDNYGLHDIAIFVWSQESTQYTTVVKWKSGTLLRLTVRRSVAEVRPVGIAAVLRNVQVDQDFFHSFIDIQVCISFEHLHLSWLLLFYSENLYFFILYLSF